MIPDVSRHQSCKQTTRMATGIMEEVLAWIMHLKMAAGGNLTEATRMHQQDMEIVLELVVALDDQKDK